MEFVIPEELLANILVRLPLKDISRLKLVCKSWLRLISSSSDPYFRINYVRNSPFTLIFRATSVKNHNNYPNKLSLSLLEFAPAGKEYTQIPLLTPKIPDHQGSDSLLTFIGSCDCSVFILHRKPFHNDHVINRVYSFNPAVLGSGVKLVVQDITGRRELRQYKVGFIPSNSTYKLLRFDPYTKKAGKAEIFTVGLDGNWRKVDVDDPLLFGGVFDYDDNGRLICFNGAYHWLSSSEYDGDHDRMIFTFHLLEEKSGAGIPKPHGVSRLSRVTILNGRLSLVDLIKDHNKKTMVIWTMKEYGVVESWSKVAVLRICDNECPVKTTRNRDGLEEWRYNHFVPIAVLANGDILFADKSSYGGMCFYNFQDKRFTRIKLPGSSGLKRIYENTFVPRFCTSDS